MIKFIKTITLALIFSIMINEVGYCGTLSQKITGWVTWVGGLYLVVDSSKLVNSGQQTVSIQQFTRDPITGDPVDTGAVYIITGNEQHYKNQMGITIGWALIVGSIYFLYNGYARSEEEYFMKQEAENTNSIKIDFTAGNGSYGLSFRKKI